jgi:replicative DNA helicase
MILISIKKDYKMKDINQYLKKQKDIINLSEENILGLTTGLKQLDKNTLGYKNKELTLIASRVGYGKTSLALKSVLANLEKDNGVLYFSLDLSAEMLLTRIISMKTRIPFSKLQKGLIDIEKIDIFNSVVEDISSQKLFIDDTKYCDIEYIKTKSNEMINKKDNNIKMIVVDYFDLIENNEHINIARELKKLAIKLDLPIVVLSQLCNKIEKRINQKPILSDIKDSSFEIEANTILFIYVDDFVKEHQEREKEIKAFMKGKEYKSTFVFKPVVEVQIIIEKNKNTKSFQNNKYELYQNFTLLEEIVEKEQEIISPDEEFMKSINDLIKIR